MDCNEVEEIKKLWNYMKCNHELKKVDCIIGLGSEDLNIAKVAVDLFFKNYADKIIFSGGLGKVTKDIWNEPEADKFAQYAIENGVPKEKVFAERGWQEKTDIPDDIWDTYEDLVRRGYDKYSTVKHKNL